MTETAGIIFGCIALYLFLNAANSKNLTSFLLGLVMLTVALFIRPGAFFVLPALIIWGGWFFREKGGRSFSQLAGLAILCLLATYIAYNQIAIKILVEPGAVSYGNFAYSLYGQVRGGIGWHSSFDDFGTTDPKIIFQGAIDFFLRHPTSFFIASVKSYRDFFLTNIGLFENTVVQRWEQPLQIALFILLIYGIWMAKKRKFNVGTLTIASLLGVVLSVPFVPPIDGGSRFYAATIPLLFFIPAIGVGILFREQETTLPARNNTLANLSSLSLPTLLIIFPIILIFNQNPANLPTPPLCPTGQDEYIAKIHHGRYIDISPSGICQSTPNVCKQNFLENSADKTTDDFFQAVVKIAEEIEGNTRLLPIYNFKDGKFHYLIGSPEQMKFQYSGDWITGCAVEIRTKNQSIYKIVPQD